MEHYSSEQEATIILLLHQRLQELVLNRKSKIEQVEKDFLFMQEMSAKFKKGPTILDHLY